MPNTKAFEKATEDNYSEQEVDTFISNISVRSESQDFTFLINEVKSIDIKLDHMYKDIKLLNLPLGYSQFSLVVPNYISSSSFSTNNTFSVTVQAPSSVSPLTEVNVGIDDKFSNHNSTIRFETVNFVESTVILDSIATVYPLRNDTTKWQVVEIPVGATTVELYLLGGAGGAGRTNSGGQSGAGGYTKYVFNASSVNGNKLLVAVGQGGQGGSNSPSTAGYGGFPHGGNAYNGDANSGGGGGRSDVRIIPSIAGLNPTQGEIDSSILLAIAGAGGGNSGYTLYGNAGAGGGSIGQNGVSPSTGGTQSAGGTSGAGAPSGFTNAGQFSGASNDSGDLTTVQTYDTGGGGDGYYGGGMAGGDARSSSGGSGYINTLYSNYISGNTYTGNLGTIPSQATTDEPLLAGYGGGTNAVSSGKAPDGQNGRVIIKFL